MKQQKGFAVMDKARQREIASKGGKSAHAKGTAHEWTSAEAQAAGRLGGSATRKNAANRRAVNAWTIPLFDYGLRD